MCAGSIDRRIILIPKRVTPVADRESSSIEPEIRNKRRWIRNEELRRIILDGAMEVLKVEGLGLSVENITFKKVFDHIDQTTGMRITNSSVIGRIWKDQADFQLALLLEGADLPVDDEFYVTLAPIAELLETADRSSLESRQATLREICRLAGKANLDWLTSSATWSIWIGAWLASVMGETTERKLELAEHMRANYGHHSDAYEEIYSETLAFLGHRVREPHTIRQLTDAIMSLTDGSAIRAMIDAPAIMGIMRPTGPGGEMQEWSLFSIGVEALTFHFAEPIPRWRPPKD